MPTAYNDRRANNSEQRDGRSSTLYRTTPSQVASRNFASSTQTPLQTSNLSTGFGQIASWVSTLQSGVGSVLDRGTPKSN